MARLETMVGAMDQAVEWWDEVEDEEDEGKIFCPAQPLTVGSTNGWSL